MNLATKVWNKKPFYGIVAFVTFQMFAIVLCAQSLTWLHVDSLEIDIAHTGLEVIGKDSIGNLVFESPSDLVIFWLREDQVKFINRWRKKKWIRNLKNPKTSYITNWMLYSLTERNISRRTLPNEATWQKLYYQDELEYWRQYLMKNKVPKAKVSLE